MELDVVCGLFANVAACTAANMATVHKNSVPTPSATPRLKWFSTTIAEVTQNSADIPYAPFPKRLRDAIEPHMQKCRAKRASMLDAIRLASGHERYDQTLKEFNGCGLSCESMFKFDYDKHRLREHFVRACGLPTKTDLRQIHLLGEGTKDRMLRSFVQNYEKFQIIYDIFVRDVCVPIFAVISAHLMQFL